MCCLASDLPKVRGRRAETKWQSEQNDPCSSVQPSTTTSSTARALFSKFAWLCKRRFDDPQRRTFDREEFEIELRTIWPTMMPVTRNPPPMDETNVPRPALSCQFTSQSRGQAVEAIGISGSGKTTLAAEVCEQSRMESPDRPVFYVEIEVNTELHDVLVGISFRLRRYGYTEAFRIATLHTAGKAPHDLALTELANGITESRTECLLVFDMVDGKCSDKFARDLRNLLGILTETPCQLAIFGQESSLRELSDLERKTLHAHTIDMPGFTFDEFLALVSQNHSAIDYGVLRDVFDALTAGRSAGLYGRLARSRSPMLRRLVKWSRFREAHLINCCSGQSARSLRGSAGVPCRAAERIACFALAFGRSEAEDVFQDVNVGIAIEELLEVGLLRDTGDDGFEMHETVRAGIEGGDFTCY